MGLKFSTTATLKMDKKQKKKFRELFFPLTRPAHISPKKRVKWRLQQKWFNRYERKRYIGGCVKIGTKSDPGYEHRITDIWKTKAGGHGYHVHISVEPIPEHGA